MRLKHEFFDIIKAVKNRLERNIYKNSSMSYYWSSRYFPKGTRDDVFKLYSFLRVMSDYARNVPVNIEHFEYIEQRWQSIKKDLQKKIVPTPINDTVDERVLANIAFIVYRHNCDPSWVDAYLKSMRLDLQKRQYRGLKGTLDYMYGSSEVVGLMMARILNLPEEALKPARMQGRAVQYISMIRDIALDAQAGRCYFPLSEIKKYGLKDLSQKEARLKPAMFTEFIHAQLLHYATWQAQANHVVQYLPKRFKVPLQTAVDIYSQTANHIKNDPFSIYEQKLEPTKREVLKQAIKRTVGKG